MPANLSSRSPRVVGRRKGPPRRTQANRRAATRQRILDATLHCLARYGYAGTGVAQVLAKARVSRGAWAHHFPSKNAMIVAAAEQLLGRVYERLASVLQGVARAEDRVPGLIHVAWREFFASEVNEVYLELLIASRRNAQLRSKLTALAGTLEQRLGGPSDLFFQGRSGAANSVAELMMLSRWVLRGIALDAPLIPAGRIEQALDALVRLMASQMQQRALPARAIA